MSANGRSKREYSSENSGCACTECKESNSFDFGEAKNGAIVKLE
jgi:hypothetical protein